ATRALTSTLIWLNCSRLLRKKLLRIQKTNIKIIARVPRGFPRDRHNINLYGKCRLLGGYLA
ncbi:MAG: hypothetical protein IJJ81_03480, partial [Ruminococcus sp.]|nr:hypothetical protein [Ruminococcus sp.]